MLTKIVTLDGLKKKKKMYGNNLYHHRLNSCSHPGKLGKFDKRPRKALENSLF